MGDPDLGEEQVGSLAEGKFLMLWSSREFLIQKKMKEKEKGKGKEERREKRKKIAICYSKERENSILNLLEDPMFL